MSTEAPLYVVTVSGADAEHFAAPSLRVAELMKAHHDAGVRAWLADLHAKGRGLYLAFDEVEAVIQEWDGAEEHAEMLAEFRYSDWGITEADLAEPDGAAQAQLFGREGGVA